MSTVAVLGTGTMGAGMARSLLRAGHQVSVWNRSAEKAQPLAQDGATVATDVAQAVSGADVVVVMVFDADAAVDVITQAAAHLGPDTVVLQSSTIGPLGARRVADLADEKGLHVLDSPVLGTRQPAEDGKLVMLVSGDPSLRDSAQPVLDAVGAKTVWAGDEPGAGSALKLACNAWVASITAATAQSIALAQGQGLDPQLFLDAIEGGASDTPYAHVKGAAMIKGGGPVGFALDGLRKDLSLMHGAAVTAGVPTVLLAALQDAYARASEAGHGGDDIAAVMSSFTPGS
jgi:3-hydroxyisobutyrate dehydrogenase